MNPTDRSRDYEKIRKSPERFLEHIHNCNNETEISSPFNKTFNELVLYCDCSPQHLFSVLRKIGLVRGPERDSFDSDILALHLPKLEHCKSLDVASLASIRDELIQKVYYASSLKIDDPSKHWTPINSQYELSPIIRAKCIEIDEALRTVAEKTAPPFRYSIIQHPMLKLGDGRSNLSKMKIKMFKGGLVYQIETMERRSLSAEQRLIEETIRNSESIDNKLNHLASVVQAECDEAYHHASLSGKQIGPQMLDDVYRRLKEKGNSEEVFKEPYETLVGIAGLLTGECKVWWSEPFDIEEQNEF